jgi:hypothetical protein
MPEVHNAIKINAAPDTVWQILGDPARAPEYIPGILTATFEGTLRVCKDDSGNEIREEIGVEDFAYSFKHLQIPLPVSRSEGRFALKPDGKTAFVQMDWEFEFLDPALEAQLLPMVDGASRLTLERLKARAEAG